jgi:hypothetical protein
MTFENNGYVGPNDIAVYPFFLSFTDPRALQGATII